MKDKVEVVQFLRGVAALLVCFFHMKGILVFEGIPVGKYLFGSGSVGVPIFFMISGFIMVITTRNGDSSLRYVGNFYLKRAIRIIPIYFILTLLFISALGDLNIYLSTFFDRLIAGVLFIPTYINHVGPSYGMPPLKVGWSLNYEIFFYLLLGLSLLAGKYRWLALTSAILFLVVMIPLYTNGYVMGSLSGWYGYSSAYLSLITNPIILYFLVGISIGRAYLSSYNVVELKYWNGVVVLFSLLFLSVYFGLVPFMKGYVWDLLIVGGLFFSVMMRNKVAPFRIGRPLVFIGDISYSLYLVHPIVLTLTPRLLKAMNFGDILHAPFYFLVVIPLIFLFSWLSFHFLEQKMCSFLSKRLITGR